MKKLYFVAIALLFGCSEGGNTSFETRISGYYQVISVTSTLPVDLNNDGFQSSDIFQEITSLHHTNDGEFSFYDFESPANYMEVRPLRNTTNNAKLVAINFPTQQIFNGEGEYYLESYMNSLYDYSYDFDATGKITLTHINTNHADNGIPHDMKVVDDGALELQITKMLFDFFDADWHEVTLTVRYEKVID